MSDLSLAIIYLETFKFKKKNHKKWHACFCYPVMEIDLYKKTSTFPKVKKEREAVAVEERLQNTCMLLNEQCNLNTHLPLCL